MANHRYWRLLIVRNSRVDASGTSDLYTVAGNIELRATIGGSDLTDPITALTAAFASSVTTVNNNYAYKAFDDVEDGSGSVSDTYWSTENYFFAHSYIGYDFGSGNEVDINEVYWFCARSATRQPRTMFLQYSDDNAKWFTKSGKLDITGWVLGQSKTFDFSVSSNTDYAVIRESSEFTVPDGVSSVDVLVVAGGGGAVNKPSGNQIGRGAGGAGGVIYELGYPVTPNETISVVVGDGGIGATASIAATNGGDSIFKSLTAIGGGRGGTGTGTAAPGDGGSGGGTTTNSGTVGLGTSGQGNDGGYSTVNTSGSYAGGGGGYSAAGGIGGTTYNSGKGGDGLDLSGTVFAGLLQEFAVGGGGGGGQYSGAGNAVGAWGGSFVGGKGGTQAKTSGDDGVANTGGGGGGPSGGSSSPGNLAKDGGNGGSGIVIISWSGIAPPGINSRVTQLPILALYDAIPEARVTQLPILALFLEKQPSRVTQLPILSLTHPKPIPLPFPLVPEVPVTESWRWNTVVNIAEYGKEQRAALRGHPRLRLSFEALLNESLDHHTIYNFLTKLITKKFNYPLYHLSAVLSATTAAGGNRLYFDPAATDIRADEPLCLFNAHSGRSFMVMVASLEADGAVLAENLAFDVSPSWLVCPAPRFRVLSKAALSESALSGTTTVDLEGVDARSILRSGQSTTVTTYDGYPVITSRPLADDTNDYQFSQDEQWLDNGINEPQVAFNWANPFVSGTRSFLIHRPQGLDYWRALFSILKGQRGTFLLPTYRNDLPLAAVPALGATVIRTSNIQYFDYWREKQYGYLSLQSDAGRVSRRVVDVKANYDTNGDPETLDITLSSGIGSGAGANQNLVVSFMNLCRLGSDDVTFTHSFVDSVVSFNVRSVNG